MLKRIQPASNQVNDEQLGKEVKRQKLDCAPKTNNELPVKKGTMLNFLVPKEEVKAAEVLAPKDKSKASAKKDMKKSVSTEAPQPASKQASAVKKAKNLATIKKVNAKETISCDSTNKKAKKSNGKAQEKAEEKPRSSSRKSRAASSSDVAIDLSKVVAKSEKSK